MFLQAIFESIENQSKTVFSLVHFDITRIELNIHDIHDMILQFTKNCGSISNATRNSLFCFLLVFITLFALNLPILPIKNSEQMGCYFCNDKNQCRKQKRGRLRWFKSSLSQVTSKI